MDMAVAKVLLVGTILLFLNLKARAATNQTCSKGQLKALLSGFTKAFNLERIIFYDLPHNEELGQLLDETFVMPSFLGDLDVSSKYEILDGMEETEKSLVLFVHGADAEAMAERSNLFHWAVPAYSWGLDGVALRLDSLVFAYNCSSDAEVLLSELYAVREKVRFSEPMGRITLQQSGSGVLEYDSHPDMWARRRDLGSITLVNSYLPYAPMNTPESDADNVTRVRGYLADIVHILEDTLNFRTEWILPPDGEWGRLAEDGRWNGIVRQMLNREADFSSGGHYVNTQRAQYIDYGIAVTEYITSLTSGYNKQRSAINFKAYIYVFTGASWAIFVILIIALAAAWWMTRRSAVDTLHLMENEPFGYLNALAVVTVAIIQREYYLCVRSPTAKLLFNITGLFGFLMFAYYSAVLTSLMTAAAPPLEIRSFEDVLMHGLDVFIWKDSAPVRDMSTAKPGTAQSKVYQDMLDSPNSSFLLSQADIVERLATDPNGLYYGPTAAFLGKPGMKVFKIEEMRSSQIGFTYPKDSEFYKAFNYYMIKLKEGGVLDLLRKHYLGDDSHTASGNQVSIVYTTGIQVLYRY